MSLIRILTFTNPTQAVLTVQRAAPPLKLLLQAFLCNVCCSYTQNPLSSFPSRIISLTSQHKHFRV